jgi:hypothetical protein
MTSCTFIDTGRRTVQNIELFMIAFMEF